MGRWKGSGDGGCGTLRDGHDVKQTSSFGGIVPVQNFEGRSNNLVFRVLGGLLQKKVKKYKRDTGAKQMLT